ncbi:MAG: glycerol-3-phosphate dehydrogenase [Bacteroidetes bacterium]|nr:glycerol-3-phosphate dehydrogenase [Bacteroidota bacterium]
MNHQFAIIGNGSWSSALVKILTDNGHAVNWWMRSKEAIAHLRNKHHNPHYLSMVNFDMQLIHLFDDLPSCIHSSDIILIGIPSAFIVETLADLPKDIFSNKKILSSIKGILPNENVILNEYLEKEFQVLLQDYCCIAGPCHAEEIAGEKLSYLTFASENIHLSNTIASYFKNHYLQTVISNDVYGVQYAAVLKNIYALGAGIAHGLDYGDNFLSVYITNCFAELQHFMDVISTQTQHHYNTSAYLGDLLVTCYSLHSRNRTFGNFIGKGYSVSATKLELNMVAEGYYASRGIYEICNKINYDLPIAKRIYEVLWKHHPAVTAFKEIEEICH